MYATKPRYNELISPAPWHFIKSRFHCTIGNVQRTVQRIAYWDWPLKVNYLMSRPKLTPNGLLHSTISVHEICCFFKLLSCFSPLWKPQDNFHLIKQIIFVIPWQMSGHQDSGFLWNRLHQCNCYKYSFFVRIVKEWNNLPEWVVGAGNLACFKRSLGSFLNIS